MGASSRLTNANIAREEDVGWAKRPQRSGGRVLTILIRARGWWARALRALSPPYGAGYCSLVAVDQPIPRGTLGRRDLAVGEFGGNLAAQHAGLFVAVHGG